MESQLQGIAKSLENQIKNLRLMRVPFQNPKTFILTDKNKPDDRELEEIDPIFNIKREQIVKVRVGSPIILQHLIKAGNQNKQINKEQKNQKQIDNKLVNQVLRALHILPNTDLPEDYTEEPIEKVSKAEKFISEQSEKIKQTLDKIDERTGPKTADDIKDIRYLTDEQSLKAQRVSVRIDMYANMNQQEKVAELQQKHKNLLYKSEEHTKQMRTQYVKGLAINIQKEENISFHKAFKKAEINVMYKLLECFKIIKTKKKNGVEVTVDDFLNALQTLYLIEGMSEKEFQQFSLLKENQETLMEVSDSQEEFIELENILEKN